MRHHHDEGVLQGSRIGRNHPGQPGSSVFSPARTWAAYSPSIAIRCVVGALLDDPPVVEHDDAVGVADRRQAVGDHQRRAADAAPRRTQPARGPRSRCRGGWWPRRGSSSPGSSAAAGRSPVAASPRRSAGSRARRPWCRSRRATPRRCRGSAPRGTPRRARHRSRRAWRSAGCRRSISWNRCGSWVTTPIAARSDVLRADRARRARRRGPLPPVTSYSRGINAGQRRLARTRRTDQRHRLARLQRQADTPRSTSRSGSGRAARSALRATPPSLRPPAGSGTSRRRTRSSPFGSTRSTAPGRSVIALRCIEHLEHPLEADHRRHQVDAGVGQSGERLVDPGDERGEGDERAAGLMLPLTTRWAPMP